MNWNPCCDRTEARINSVLSSSPVSCLIVVRILICILLSAASSEQCVENGWLNHMRRRQTTYVSSRLSIQWNIFGCNTIDNCPFYFHTSFDIQVNCLTALKLRPWPPISVWDLLIQTVAFWMESSVKEWTVRVSLLPTRYVPYLYFKIYITSSVFVWNNFSFFFCFVVFFLSGTRIISSTSFS